MLPWLRNLIWSLLWDETVAQRRTAFGCWFLGALFESGGVIPGTTLVIPGVDWGPLAAFAPLLKGMAVYIASGSSVPWKAMPPPRP